MLKNQLVEALSFIQDDATVVKGTFVFDRPYSAVYDCRITSVTLTYNKDNSLEATIHFKEKAEDNSQNNDVISMSSVVSSMSKDKLLAAVSLISDETANVLADFQYNDPWPSNSYQANIYGVELHFEPSGIEVILCAREIKEESGKAAA